MISATESPTVGVGARREVDDPEIDAHQFGQFPADHLAGPGDFEGGPLDQVGQGAEIAIRVFLHRRPDHAGAADADVEGPGPLTGPVEGTGP